jgi:hypothetical protein
MTSRKIQYWVIPPEADAEFVAAMERVLDTYEKPYDADHPVLCMDEQPVQLTQETRQPIPATRRHAKRVDYEYERAGTASILQLLSFILMADNSARTKMSVVIESSEVMATSLRPFGGRQFMGTENGNSVPDAKFVRAALKAG